MEASDIMGRLTASGVSVAPGLSGEEFDRTECEFGFRFPPDLRDLLSAGVPISKGWVDWRGNAEEIRARMAWPADGICFDIEHSSFWLEEWGARPPALAEALEVARFAVSKAPVLIPIFSHRYIPAVPCEAGNPVYSVYQTDITHYGADLDDYLCNELKRAFGRKEHSLARKPRGIPLWTKLVELNGA